MYDKLITIDTEEVIECLGLFHVSIRSVDIGDIANYASEMRREKL